jgi:membrane-bound serine protease (ClpP class)
MTRHPGARVTWWFGCLMLAALSSSALVTAGAATGLFAPADGAPIYVAEVDAIVHPVSAEFMIETMDRADEARAALAVFVLRTPGGLLDSTRDIVSRMLRATTPVAVFIAPAGARAASAGFILTIAADVAAMAPATHLGAAHPVSGSGEKMDETLAKKSAEDVAAYARTIAAARQRNVELAGQAVLNSRAFTEGEAVGASPPLIDLIASDVPELLRKLDGRTIRRFDGSSAVLNTRDATITPITMTRRQRVLSAIAHPTIAYLLLSLGMLGLTIELWSPGAVLPGVVGALSLLLASFALQLLPINYAGVLLILVGLVMFGLELKVASYGLLSVGGAVSLTFGSLMLMDSSVPDLQLRPGFVVPVVAGMVGIAVVLARLSLAAQRAPVTTGSNALVGLVGETISPLGANAPGRVKLRGEIWRATADQRIDAGARVQVTQVDGLTLKVRQE